MLIQTLIDAIQEKKSPIVVGLDPRLGQIPDAIKEKYFKTYGKTFKAAAESIVEFNMVIIDAVADLVPAVKPQIAFYEQYGIEGLEAYKRTCEYAQEKGLVVIGDIKRGDIGSTSDAYADGHLGFTEVEGEKHKAFSVDMVTVNPYLGDDSLKSFADRIEAHDKGMFVLVKTSNPTSSQLQNLKVEGRTIYEIVAGMVHDWTEKTPQYKGYSPIGAVVGATYPEESVRLRELMPKAYFLVPGYGAQGATGKDITGCFNKDGLGAIVNSSRGIIFAYQKEVYAGLGVGEAARKAVQDMQEDINSALENADKRYW